ncbi:riboflavin-binding protein-like [Actinia tenebrosa]|uniref:Riboflavin-binding protein-like n=1 Tax=Actinia tenebrosa TaxID=6105 RepID=A0A6P8IE35_ACTTE|nr:riboflavin-binding protein-like [Actinia tenebrosa]
MDGAKKGPGFATCFPWKNKSCCWANTTVELKKNIVKNILHLDWEYCGNLSESCKKYLLHEACFYFCDPNLVKWKTTGAYVSELPICSDACDKWLEACKNDKTYSENWMDDYTLYHSKKGPIKTNRPCRTFAEVFQNGEGLCNKVYGLAFKYERSSNCLVFNFKGENPNDKVVPAPSSSS